MRRFKVLIVTAIVAATPLFATKPASAMTCSPDLDAACRVIATVVCGVVAKGRPCLA